MPDALKKKYGPFAGWQWLLILIAGIGLGLLVRSQLKNRSGPTTPAQQGSNNLPATQGAPTIVQEPAESTIALQKKFDRFREELDERQKPVSNEPIDSGGEGDQRGPVRIPEQPWKPIPIIIPDGPEDNSEPAPAPRPTVDTERQEITQNILKIFEQEGLPPPNQTRLNRLVAGVESWNAGNKVQGRSYASIREGLQSFKANQ